MVETSPTARLGLLILGCLLLSGCDGALPPALSNPSPAATPAPGGSPQDLHAWRLGSSLSLAALGNADGAPKLAVDSQLEKAKESARELSVHVAPLPLRSGNSTQDSVAALGYLLKKGGADIARSLEVNGSRRPSLLFQVALKANLLLLLYQPSGEDRESKAIAEFVAAKLTEAQIPKELWSPLVDQVNSQAPPDQVKTSLKQMHLSVANYLAGRSETPAPTNSSGPTVVDPAPVATSGGPLPPSLPPGAKYLRSLRPVSMQIISDPAHAFDRDFQLRGATYRQGVYIHPPQANSTGGVVYNLEAGYVRLKGVAGVGDSRFRRSLSPLTFQVVGDGKVLWSSQPLQTAGDWEAFDVDLTGVKQLTLAVTCSGDHTGAHGSWLDPILLPAAP